MLGYDDNPRRKGGGAYGTLDDQLQNFDGVLRHTNTMTRLFCALPERESMPNGA